MQNRKKSNTQKKSLQTHFIGILVPDELSFYLEKFRAYMQEKYSCKSGQTTPLHVTLVPPFDLTKEFSDETLAEAVHNAKNRLRILPFTARIENFGAFGARTIYSHVVPDDCWTTLRDAVFKSITESCPRILHRDTRPFTPHITIANRDIPPDAIADSLQYFSATNYSAQFDVNEITVFKRVNGRWNVCTWH